MTESFIFARVKFYDFKGIRAFPCYSPSGDPCTLEFFMKLDDGRDRYTFRILYPPKEIVYGEDYVVQMRFFMPSMAIPRLKVGQCFEIEWGKIIGEGLVLEIHDYGDLNGPWNLTNDPWRGMPFKHPDFYLRLCGKNFPVCACFVSRRFPDDGGIRFLVAKTAPSIGDDCREIVVLEYSGCVGKTVEVWMAERDDTGALMLSRHVGVGVLGSWTEVTLPKEASCSNGLKNEDLLHMQQLFYRLLTALPQLNQH